MSYLGNDLLNKVYSFTPITATAGQTAFTAQYTPGMTIFFLHKASGGDKILLPGVDITATDGSTATLASAAAAGDVLVGISLAQFQMMGSPYGGGILAHGDTALTSGKVTASTSAAPGTGTFADGEIWIQHS